MSLRGSYKARIDDRSRLKVPVEFRRHIGEQWGNELFVTSFTGADARVFPLPVWQGLEQALLAMPPVNAALMRFQKIVNFFGQTQSMDAQGRVLVQSPLRDKAELNGEVTVLGYGDHLFVQNYAAIDDDVSRPLSDEEFAMLGQLWSNK